MLVRHNIFFIVNTKTILVRHNSYHKTMILQIVKECYSMGEFGVIDEGFGL